jgi:6,7-dimethyl-8-ribityllumazine synthase
MKVYEGKFDAKDLKFGIIVSRFHEFITERLKEGALDCLLRHGAKEENIDIYRVSGCFEIPGLVQRILPQNKYNAIICLGVVIRGDTPHFDYIASQVIRGIAQLNLSSKIPIVLGILTTDSIEQAIERSGTKMGNKGWSAAETAIEMASLYNILE